MLDAAEQKLVDDVARHGWQVMRVSPATGEAQEPSFAYTIGLQETFGWPELLCYGLNADVMTVLLNNATDELRERSELPSAGLVLHEIAEGFDCKLSPVASRHNVEHLGFAIWFARYRGENPAKVECLQLLWPDRHGRFPDQSDCSPEVRELQPLLSS